MADIVQIILILAFGYVLLRAIRVLIRCTASRSRRYMLALMIMSVALITIMYAGRYLGFVSNQGYLTGLMLANIAQLLLYLRIINYVEERLK